MMSQASNGKAKTGNADFGLEAELQTLPSVNLLMTSDCLAGMKMRSTSGQMQKMNL